MSFWPASAATTCPRTCARAAPRGLCPSDVQARTSLYKLVQACTSSYKPVRACASLFSVRCRWHLTRCRWPSDVQARHLTEDMQRRPVPCTSDRKRAATCTSACARPQRFRVSPLLTCGHLIGSARRHVHQKGACARLRAAERDAAVTNNDNNTCRARRRCRYTDV